MANTMIKIHDISTDEIVEREATAEELAQIELDAAEAEAKAIAESEKQAAKVALLARLGITEQEARLLLS